MTQLPIDSKWPISTEPTLPEKSGQNYYHNWLYSVVPVSERVTDWSKENSEIVSYPLGAYLTGYCRNCSKAFSQPIPCDASGYKETQMNIPKFGCVAPERI